ncbi:MAG: rod shape-determining protein MreC [Sedimentisphaerales bacterium]|nr:rod shape-determining protein MreC [Sedimentisphaerales bacterium]
MIPDVRHFEFRLTVKRVFFLCMAGSLACLLFVPSEWTDRLDHFLATVLGPITRTSQNAQLAVTEKIDVLCDPTVSVERYDRLLDEYRKLQAEYQNLRQLAEQQQQWIERLTGLRQHFGLARVRLTTAEVVDYDCDTRRRAMRLRCDSTTALAEGQHVLAPVQQGKNTSEDILQQQCGLCVIGRVISIAGDSAKVQLIDDPGFSLPVFIEPHPRRVQETWRVQGVLRGRSLDKPSVTMVTAETAVLPGDGVYACSDPAALPVAVLVGYVETCRRNDSDPVLWDITLRPAADLNRLRDVVIVDASVD